tara:strand:- start:107 stop:250 length:144 start_codon:yes stop_codon:yes gene_type:complete
LTGVGNDSTPTGTNTIIASSHGDQMEIDEKGTNKGKNKAHKFTPLDT